MKPASGALITLVGELGGAQTVFVAELLTITLADGTVLRYTTGIRDITISGNTFSSMGPYPIIGTTSWRTGVEVDVLKLELWALLTNIVESHAILAGIVQGLFDNALVLVQRVFMPTYGDTSAGAVTLFQGNVSDIPVADSIHAELDVKSGKEKLNIPMPYHFYQPACRWPLFSPGCTLVASSVTISSVNVTAGSGQLLLVATSLIGNPDHYFDEGYITFTTGPNAGTKRAVREFLGSTGQILLFVPLPSLPAVGDHFDITPGCDKKQATCDSKFHNLINFGGMPYIPIPETSV